MKMLSILANTDLISVSTDGVIKISVSWLGIVVAVIAAMIIGSIWYGPLFGNKWMKLVGLKRGQSSPLAPMLIMLGLSIIQALILAHFIGYVSYFYPDMSNVSIGLLTGLWAFVGFVLPVLVSNAIFAKGSMTLLKINLGNQLITLLVIGVILATVH